MAEEKILLWDMVGMFCSIYRIRNRLNGKVYVGQTWGTLKKRFKDHRTCTYCSKLYGALRKWGHENFFIELVIVAHTQTVADYWESHFIQKWDTIRSGYNLREGGSRGRMSEESKRKISAANKGKVLSAEHIAKMSASSKGHAVSPETRAKLAEASRGKTPSKETRAKIGAKSKGHVTSEETKAKMSATKKGHAVSEETRAKIAAALRGRKPTPETIAKLSQARKGRSPSPETRAKISSTLTGHSVSEETRQKISVANRKDSRELSLRSATPV